MKESFFKDPKNLLEIRKIIIGEDTEWYSSKCKELDMSEFKQ